ncbi:hypothetical protein BHM03_00042776 [Ensete ventricosum]|nr:hypothetical protein BHM03_00042776 [Ensete ventricosum]
MPSSHAAAAARPLYVSATSRRTTKVTPPIPKEACVQDHHSRDDPRNKPTELCIEDHRGSVNPRQEVSTLINVGGLTHSDENRFSRHLSSTH